MKKEKNNNKFSHISFLFIERGGWVASWTALEVATEELAALHIIRCDISLDICKAQIWSWLNLTNGIKPSAFKKDPISTLSLLFCHILYWRKTMARFQLNLAGVAVFVFVCLRNLSTSAESTPVHYCGEFLGFPRLIPFSLAFIFQKFLWANWLQLHNQIN